MAGYSFALGTLQVHLNGLEIEYESMAKSTEPQIKRPIRYIDLFAGIGGFRIAVTQASKKLDLQTECVFSSDIDEDARKAYQTNFGDLPSGDITKIHENQIPDHDILFGGFPCQAFSIIGSMKGFEDTRGTLFFDIARILKKKKPRAFVLENVKQLRGHDGGRTLATILLTLRNLGYKVETNVLNALDYGLAQKRERIFIVGFLESKSHQNFSWPSKVSSRPALEKILEPDENVPKSFFVSDHILNKRKQQVTSKELPSGRLIWHENKSGNISALPYSCALRAGASYNYLLVDGVRRLTPREMLRIQGFPETFKIACSDSATRKQAGNSVPVPMVRAVISKVLEAIR